MLLAKHRIPLFITGLIALFAVVLLFSIERVNAGSSVGTLPDADFEEGLGIVGVTTGWNWTGDGNQIKVGVFLDAALTNVAEIEVFVGDSVTTSTVPSLSKRPTAGGTFPTGVNIVFAGTISGLTTALVPGTTKVGIHLADAADADIVRSAAPTNTGLDGLDLTVPVSAPVPTATRVIAQPPGSPTPAASPTPPAAGDVAPSSSMVLGIMLGGLLLVTVGGVYMVGVRRAKQ